MARVSGIAESLDIRLKNAVKAYDLNINDLAGRTLSEGFLRYWHVGMGEAPIQLKGGELFAQDVRATSDADITTVHRYLPHEFLKGSAIIAGFLRREGIELEVLSEPKLIDVGHGDPVTRWKLRGLVGGVKATSQIELTYGRGPDAFSAVNVFREIPSLISKVPSLLINCQPLEAAAAEKLLAVINQPDTDMRVKHVADMLDERLWEGVDCGLIARELQRVCRHRGIDPTSLPDTLAVETYERLRENWTKRFRPGMPTVGFDQAISNVDYLWSEVQDCMTPSMRPLPTSAPVVAERRVGGMR
ncbi:hypothetical protein BJF92_13615 [Rhizobium rhizosphaerae]|uniref:Nucleotidyl transferase AbiEii/AbiGii toxin family protein n=1 Tax=Xaviernesmea rhizosphaerae TaxID=1672749 RepID=A0A1Q9AHX5_9HYPH|nr:nucleotidyl transferase AbiEii/AbiGii toxin family protein [Xaviernesmea rhizosphaerae]OLP54842.1 hypothetical protein BJF92_13615 [Xaviernesmea rhizosphaerae]